MPIWFNDVITTASMTTLNEEEEYQEEEVWDVLKEDSSTPSSNKKASKASSMADHSSACFVSAEPKEIPKPKVVDNLEVLTNKPFSAPQKIPNWSTVYKKDLNKKLVCVDANEDDGRFKKDFDEEDDDEDGGEMIPPHEYIARKLKRKQIVCYSMLEGIGRTLKGRDLRKVRNAILYKTGFLE